MTKTQLQMRVNELEAQVVELQVKLQVAEGLADEAKALTSEADDIAAAESKDRIKAEAMVEEIREEHERFLAERPTIPFDEWYRMLHPKPGGEPDLQAVRYSEHVRIIG